jgi:spermidine synthase
VTGPQRRPFLTGVFLLTFALLVFQIVQTRILSVLAWYYLAFFAICVAMLGMTAGAVWVYARRARLAPDALSTRLSDTALMTAVAMPASMMVQLSLVTTLAPTATSMFAFALSMAVMTVPYVFAGITISLALTRSPYPVSQVYGVDMLGAAVGCAAVVGLLEVVDGPSAVFVAGLCAALAALAFARAAPPDERAALALRARWRRPSSVVVALVVLIPFNAFLPGGVKPLLVKGNIDSDFRERTELWNSYSRVVAHRPVERSPSLWAPSPLFDAHLVVPEATLSIDGAVGTAMHHFDGTKQSIDFLRYDMVNLAYCLPGIRKVAVIGIGGGRDLMSAHLFGAEEITGVEVNRILVDLMTRDRFYAPYANLSAIPGLVLHVDDARSWFAASRQSFDLIQMSMIDTWASTGAGAFSLTENGLYTLEGWRTFVGRLNGDGVFTVSRWYDRGDVNETGRMVALALATVMDGGALEARRHLFVAHSDFVATMVLSKSPLTPARLERLRGETARLGFRVLVDPDAAPASEVLRRMVAATDIAGLDAIARTAALDLSVATDRRPFFFNQLRLGDVPGLVLSRTGMGDGVFGGNLIASIMLLLILWLASLAVIATIVLPLRAAARNAPRKLLFAGTLYFSLIGMGFMFAEISLLQFFGVFLGHPTYAMSVCLFGLILSSGLGSLASGRFPLDGGFRFAGWGLAVGGYLLLAQSGLPRLFAATAAAPLTSRVLICLAAVMPVGFLMGFAFPTGMRRVQRIDAEPTPWFWGINGATGVLASVVAVMIGISFGINVTMAAAGACYLALLPTARLLQPARSD